MEKPPYIPTMRLNFQGSICCNEKAEAEIFYDALKKAVITLDPKAMLNGQVIMMLEPCCNKSIERTA
jgi:hypothetical protein